jgi:hypothetical protein
MNPRLLILVGAVAGVILGNTEQGRKLYKEAGKRVASFWRDPRVQSRVGDIQDRVADVPVVGENVADLINSTRPKAGSTDE